MKNQIKELRIKIDGLAQLIKELKPITQKEATESYKGEMWNFKKEGTERVDTGWRDDNSIKVNSKEIDKSTDSLYLAKAWLGKLLGELGTKTPYKSDGKRKTVKDVEPAADVANDKTAELPSKIDWETKNHIEKVDWLRQEIEKITEEVSKWYIHTKASTREFSITRTNAYNYLCEARIWLGFELGRIRENK